MENDWKVETMYKVSEVAKIAGITVSAVYKAIGRLNGKYMESINGVKHINEDGYKILMEKFAVKKEDKYKSQNNDNIIQSLLNQLEEKDKQISAKDNQIETLMEQARNYQILLKAEQDRFLLEPPKKGLFSRIFNRK
jgi:DNA-directed RNA polymerase specialized sigma subunit